MKTWRFSSKIKFPNQIEEENAVVELSVDVPEIRRLLSRIVLAPSKLFDELRQDVRQSMSRYLNQLMESEITVFLG
ncbi:MAG: hypothetical protein ACE5HN_04410, partial [Nitrospiria bacterium]